MKPSEINDKISRVKNVKHRNVRSSSDCWETKKNIPKSCEDAHSEVICHNTVIALQIEYKIAKIMKNDNV